MTFGLQVNGLSLSVFSVGDKDRNVLGAHRLDG